MAGHCKYSYLVLVLFMIYNGAHGSKCEGQNVVKFQEGKTYVYNYEEVEESWDDGSPLPTRVITNARVEVTAQPNCVTLINILNMKMTGRPNPSYLKNFEMTVNLEEFKKNFIDFFLRIPTAESGTRIEPNVAFGCRCPMKYTVSVKGDITTVTKFGDLNKCDAKWNGPDGPESRPLLNTFGAQYRLKSGIIESATVQEVLDLGMAKQRSNSKITRIA